jgi:signal transduction histidine kinase
MYTYQLKAKQITIQMIEDFTDLNKKTFKTDPAKLQLIISNLIANAIEYSHPRSEIVVKIWIQKEVLHISVQDFGVGINKADQDIIFNRFTQLDSGITKSHRGHGLGLSVTKALLEVLDGKIEVNSKLSEGSTFTVSIQESEAEVEHFATDGNELFFNEGELF